MNIEQVLEQRKLLVEKETDNLIDHAITEILGSPRLFAEEYRRTELKIPVPVCLVRETNNELWLDTRLWGAVSNVRKRGFKTELWLQRDWIPEYQKFDFETNVTKRSWLAKVFDIQPITWAAILVKI